MSDSDAKSDNQKEENESDGVDNASDGDKGVTKPEDDTTAFVDTNEIKSLGMPTHHPPKTWDSQLLFNYFDTREGKPSLGKHT
ncbi:unnamed protein product [Lactuca virosa]|uniref:Uncharacterized protein n=1 Tax=Lactuca virosa TaxID=75947 RepID=A0AAU9PTF0_9ASTR|nr:unnamed protein product [Lactuca virosa]